MAATHRYVASADIISNVRDQLHMCAELHHQHDNTSSVLCNDCGRSLLAELRKGTTAKKAKNNARRDLQTSIILSFLCPDVLDDASRTEAFKLVVVRENVEDVRSLCRAIMTESRKDQDDAQYPSMLYDIRVPANLLNQRNIGVANTGVTYLLAGIECFMQDLTRRDLSTDTGLWICITCSGDAQDEAEKQQWLALYKAYAPMVKAKFYHLNVDRPEAEDVQRKLETALRDNRVVTQTVTRQGERRGQRVNLLREEHSRLVLHVIGHGNAEGRWLHNGRSAGDLFSAVQHAMHTALMSALGVELVQHKLSCRDIMMMFSCCWSDKGVMRSAACTIKREAEQVESLLKAYPILTYNRTLFTAAEGAGADMANVGYLFQHAGDGSWDVSGWMLKVPGFQTPGGPLQLRWYDAAGELSAAAAGTSTGTSQGIAVASNAAAVEPTSAAAAVADTAPADIAPDTAPAGTTPDTAQADTAADNQVVTLNIKEAIAGLIAQLMKSPADLRQQKEASRKRQLVHE